ncbi:MAG: Uncharacterized protein conserved in bacteria, partial [uncultured Paraburkholderia sp.]
MYVINLTYIAPLDKVDDALEAHREFLTRQFEAGVFLAAGPKTPRDGGIILAVRLGNACARWSCCRNSTSMFRTSRYEGMPMALIEAQVAGIPAV